jgi:hypothetical protein
VQPKPVVEPKPVVKPVEKVTKAFNGAEGKSWGDFDLNAMVKQNNLPEAKRIIVKDIVAVSSNPRLKDTMQLKLTAETEFSMYLFDKLNKGFANSQKINCFMNVVLQSLLASPAFYNLLLSIP